MGLRLEVGGLGVTINVESLWEHEGFLGFGVLEWMELVNTVLDFLVDGIIVLNCISCIQSRRELIDMSNHTLIIG